MRITPISTRNVDNYVDKLLLTSLERSIDAGFNKLHNEKAFVEP